MMKKSEIERTLKELQKKEEIFKNDKTPNGKKRLMKLRAGITSLKAVLSFAMATDGEITDLTPVPSGDKIVWMVTINGTINRTF